MQVRSCTLDTWLQSQVDFMDQTGNAIANSYWECKIGAVQRPSSGPHLEAFIRRKYNGEWAEGTWPPAVALSIPAPDTGAAGSHEQGVEAVAEPTAAGEQAGMSTCLETCLASHVASFRASQPEVRTSCPALAMQRCGLHSASVRT